MGSVNQLEQVPCSLCGAERAALECLTVAHPPSSGGEWRLVRCEGCGLVYLNPRPTEQAIAEFYPSEYYENSEALMLAATRWRPWPGLRKWVKRRLAEEHYRTLSGRSASERVLRRVLSLWKVRWGALPPRNRPGRMLDIGCGTGYYLELLRDAGWEVVGTEIGDGAIAICRSKGFEVLKGQADQLQLPDQSFDVVHIAQVLEHVHRPRAILETACRVLRPDGLLLLDVPNYEAPLRRLFGPSWFSVEAPRHLYHFSALTLRRLLETSGFAVDRLYTRALSQGAGRHLEVTSQMLRRAMPEGEALSRGVEVTAQLNALAEQMGCGDTLYVEAHPRGAA